MAAVYTAKGGRSEPDAGTFPPKNTQAGVKRGVAPLLTNAKMIKVEESSEDENTSLAEQIPTRVRSETATMDAIPAIAIKEESIEDDEYVQIKLVDVEESSEERTENNESDRDNESIDEWSVKGEDDKIIGGYECPRHSQPWQVYLTYDDGNRWCGASMINERWAVSAAHCYVP